MISKVIKLSLLASVITLVLAGCNDSDNSDEQVTSGRILSPAPTNATEDISFQYQVDVGGLATPEFSLNNAPEGMTVSDLGLVQWTPIEGVLTSGEVTVVVKSGDETVTQTFKLTVTPVNDAPVVTVVGDQQVDSGETLILQLGVADPDDENNGTDLRFEKVAGPEKLTVSTTGEISYTSAVTASQIGNVTVRVSDGGEDNAQPAEVTFSLDEIYHLIISGTLADYYNNDVIAGGKVKLSANNVVAFETESDETGAYSVAIADRLLAERMTLSADAQGYREGAVTIRPAEIALPQKILLPPVHGSVVFEPTQAQQLKVEDQVLVSLPANSLVDSQGNAVTTAVTAELNIIDSTMDIHLMPGEMVTRDENGEILPIESFGAITVTFADESGAPLQLAEGQQADIRIPATGIAAPAVIPLYYYDPIQGIWIEEGEATLVSDVNGDYYAGTVSHFTTWNADRIYETVYINGCVENTEQQRIANARLQSEGLDYNGRSTSYSNSAGEFSIPVRMESEILLSARLGQQSRTQTISTLTEDITLDSCLLLDTASTQITLRWGEAPRDLDSHFFGPDGNGSRFHVYFSAKEAVVNNERIFLDVDDTDSYGPEVVSLFEYPLAGKYSYYVHNYSNEILMDRTTTNVRLAIDGQVTPFMAPVEQPTRWWHVFDIEVAEGKSFEVVTVNQWVESPDQNQVVPQSFSVTMPSILQRFVENKYYAK
ncbi:Ig-like domain-containing protein [Photobacterium sp. SDRW27]|uniref:YfaP family protein n=1 Tax=Photobacterium obscurum TaxID=2829490 RepID=UPI0022441AA5|nr:Ig-like domain-containing protein [Photobacterium obscurum]MCW8328755.1 Ig-like domain-containing protein [Photobacterium obscurum]